MLHFCSALTTALETAKTAIMPAPSLVCIYKNPFEKTASVAGMRRKLPRNVCKAKPNKCPVVEAASAASDSAGQILKRLIVLEFRDVLDRYDRDIQ